MMPEVTHTRAKPMEYRGYKIHNETLSGNYNTYKGSVKPDNLQSFGHQTLEEAKAYVDRFVAEDQANQPAKA